MPVEALRKQWDGRAARAELHRSMTFVGDDLVLGARTRLGRATRKLFLRKQDSEAFDEARVGALLAVAYGRLIDGRQLAHIRGALQKQSEGATTLALMNLALANLPKLQSPAEDAWRLASADELMRCGAAPGTIIEALGLIQTAPATLARAYDPNQPRVPAGSGRESGQWTSGDVEGGSSSDNVFNESRPPPLDEALANRPIQIADSSDNWVQYLNPVGAAQAAVTGRPPFNGTGPNNQHDQGVAKAIAWYRAAGYKILSDHPFAVNIPGFLTPRIYDFGVQDISGKIWGAEIKTTKFDTIFLNPAQVVRDVVLYGLNGVYVPSLGGTVTGIMYVTYCNGCDAIDLRSFYLVNILRLAKIHVYTEHDSIP